MLGCGFFLKGDMIFVTIIGSIIDNHLFSGSRKAYKMLSL